MKKKTLFISIVPFLLLAGCGNKPTTYSVTYSESNYYTFEGPAELVNETEFDFTLSYRTGYQGEIAIEGAEYQISENGYHAFNVTGDVNLSVENLSKIRLSVTTPSSDYYTFNGNDYVEYGNTYEFSIAYVQGYKGVAYVNGNEVEPVDGTYKVENVTENLVITVETSKKKVVVFGPQDENPKYTYTASATSVEYGDDFTFNLEFNEGYFGNVKANDQTILPKEDGKTFTVENVTQVIYITVDTYFTVTTPSESDQYVFEGAESGLVGEDYIFNLTFKEYTSGTVLVNNNPVEGVNGQYTVPNVQESLIITVSNVVCNELSFNKDHKFTNYATTCLNAVSNVEYDRSKVVKTVFETDNFGSFDFEVFNFEANANFIGAWCNNNIYRFIRNTTPINGIGSIKVSMSGLTVDLGVKAGDEILYTSCGNVLIANTPFNVSGNYSYLRLVYTGTWNHLDEMTIMFRNNVIEPEFNKSVWLESYAAGTAEEKNAKITDLCVKTCDNNGNPIDNGSQLSISKLDSTRVFVDGTSTGSYINTQRRIDETYTWNMPCRSFYAHDKSSLMFMFSNKNFELSLDGHKVAKSFNNKDEVKIFVYEGAVYANGSFVYSLAEEQVNGESPMAVSVYAPGSSSTSGAAPYAWVAISSYFTY